MSLLDNAIGMVKENPVATAIGAGAVGVGVGVGVASLIGSSPSKKARKSRKKITHTKRGLKQDRKRKSKQPWEIAYRRRKRRNKINRRRKNKSSSRGLHYTKKGQPYKIMSNGRARFVKKTKRRAR